MTTDRDRRRRRAFDARVDQGALEDMESAHGDVRLAPVAIVVAAYKEVDNIGPVVASMPERLCGLDTSVVVVVDGDDDGTAAIVRGAGHVVAVAPVNRGQGAALRLGYRIARERGARYVVTADADGQTRPEDLAVVLEPVVAGSADFVNGSRRLGTTQSTGVVRNVGVRVFGLVITALTGTRVTDTANPVRAFEVGLPDRLVLEEPQYQASELLIGAIMSGARFTERPVTMRARTSGRSKKGGNLAYGFRYTNVVFRTFLREARRSRWPRRPQLVREKSAQVAASPSRRV